MILSFITCKIVLRFAINSVISTSLLHIFFHKSLYRGLVVISSVILISYDLINLFNNYIKNCLVFFIVLPKSIVSNVCSFTFS